MLERPRGGPPGVLSAATATGLPAACVPLDSPPTAAELACTLVVRYKPGTGPRRPRSLPRLDCEPHGHCLQFCKNCLLRPPIGPAPRARPSRSPLHAMPVPSCVALFTGLRCVSHEHRAWLLSRLISAMGDSAVKAWVNRCGCCEWYVILQCNVQFELAGWARSLSGLAVGSMTSQVRSAAVRKERAGSLVGFVMRTAWLRWHPAAATRLPTLAPGDSCLTLVSVTFTTLIKTWNSFVRAYLCRKVPVAACVDQQGLPCWQAQ